jgi:hypothetical protein
MQDVPESKDQALYARVPKTEIPLAHVAGLVMANALKETGLDPPLVVTVLDGEKEHPPDRSSWLVRVERVWYGYPGGSKPTSEAPMNNMQAVSRSQDVARYNVFTKEESGPAGAADFAIMTAFQEIGIVPPLTVSVLDGDKLNPPQAAQWLVRVERMWYGWPGGSKPTSEDAKVGARWPASPRPSGGRGARTPSARGAHRRRGAPADARPTRGARPAHECRHGRPITTGVSAGWTTHASAPAPHGCVCGPRPAHRYPLSDRTHGPGRIRRVPAPPPGTGRALRFAHRR